MVQIHTNVPSADQDYCFSFNSEDAQVAQSARSVQEALVAKRDDGPQTSPGHSSIITTAGIEPFQCTNPKRRVQSLLEKMHRFDGVEGAAVEDFLGQFGVDKDLPTHKQLDLAYLNWHSIILELGVQPSGATTGSLEAILDTTKNSAKSLPNWLERITKNVNHSGSVFSNIANEDFLGRSYCKADFNDAKFTNTRVLTGARKFEDCDFSDASFNRADIASEARPAVLGANSELNFSDADFTDSKLFFRPELGSYLNLSGAELHRSSLRLTSTWVGEEHSNAQFDLTGLELGNGSKLEIQAGCRTDINLQKMALKKSSEIEIHGRTGTSLDLRGLVFEKGAKIKIYSGDRKPGLRINISRAELRKLLDADVLEIDPDTYCHLIPNHGDEDDGTQVNIEGDAGQIQRRLEAYASSV